MMKSPLVLLVCTLGVLIPLRAAPETSQPAGGRRPTPAQVVAQATRLILARVDGLTLVQKSKVAEVLDRAGSEAQALLDQPSLSKEEKRAKMGDLQNRTLIAVRAILTVNQARQFDALVAAAVDHPG